MAWPGMGPPYVVGRSSCEKQEVHGVLPGGPRGRSQGSGTAVVAGRVAASDLAPDWVGSKDGAAVREGGPAGRLSGGGGGGRGRHWGGGRAGAGARAWGSGGGLGGGGPGPGACGRPA